MGPLPVAIAVTLTLAMLSAANAAGPLTPASPAPSAPAYDWTGFYIGGNFGGAWAHTSFTGTDATSVAGEDDLSVDNFSGTSKANGWFGGGQVGVNYQFQSNLVIGIEGDFQGSSLSESSSYCAAAAGGVTGCGSGSSKLKEFGTLRGRLGYALNNWLIYGTGGWAWGNSSATGSITCNGGDCPGNTVPFTAGSSSSFAKPSGWAAGAGVEWAFLPNLSLRIEYLHVQFKDANNNFIFKGSIAAPASDSGDDDDGDPPFTTATGTRSDSNIDMVRVGVTYLFR